MKKYLSVIFIVLLLILFSFISINAVGEAGTVDSTFINLATDVSDNLPEPNKGRISDIVVQLDDKILFSSRNITYDGHTLKAINRLNSDGSFDDSFDIGAGASGGGIEMYVPTSNGKIMVGGDFTSFNGTPANKVVRLNSNGTVDTSFISSITDSDYFGNLLPQPDGKVLVFGDIGSKEQLVRLNSNGSVDDTFNANIPNVTPNCYSRKSLALQVDGKILLGAYDKDYYTNVIRLNSDGSLDTSFNQISGGDYYDITHIELQSDGKIYVGFSETDVRSSFSSPILRFNSDGSPDNTFNASTVFEYPSHEFEDFIVASDKVVVVRYRFDSSIGNNVIRLLRLDTYGSLDPDFYLSSEIPTLSSILGLATQSDGKILVSGKSTIGHIYRLFSDTVTPSPTPTSTPTPTPTPTSTPTPTPTSTPTPIPTSSPLDTSTSSSSSSAPSCNDSKPISSPDLFQIDITQNKAKLFFTPVTNIDQYYLSFSTNPNAEEHGTLVRLAREGVQNFTVNLLKPNTIYYFKVRAQNGCMPGDWSNALKAITRSRGINQSISFYEKFSVKKFLGVAKTKITPMVNILSSPVPTESVIKATPSPKSTYSDTMIKPTPTVNSNRPKRCFLWWCF